MVESSVLNTIYRYPVKGLSPEPMTQTMLRAGETLPADRRYAIENGPSGFEPANPRYFPKIKFLMLMRNERLAALQTHYDEDSHTLTILHNGAEVARGNLQTEDGRITVEAFFADSFAPDLTGPPKLLFAPGHSFSDVARKVVSVINLASVSELENAVGQPVNPLRFRGNLYVAGWPAWHEFTLMGQTITIGDARLKIVKRIVRCAAINVDPDTALRDLSLPRDLMHHYGHNDCGVYAEVIADGKIAIGDRIETVST
jgi:uncharacterized protein